VCGRGGRGGGGGGGYRTRAIYRGGRMEEMSEVGGLFPNQGPQL